MTIDPTRRSQFSHTTAFLRNRPQLEELAGKLLPTLWPNGGELSVLIVGGSTGAEALSLLVALREFSPEATDKLDARVISLDVAESVAAIGQNGRYTTEEFLPLFGQEGGMSVDVRTRWFVPCGENIWCPKAELAERVSFQTMDLLTEDFPGADSFDLIICQNVLTHLVPPIAALLRDRLLALTRSKAALVISGLDLDLKASIPVADFHPWLGRVEEIHEAFWSHRMHYRENRGQHYFELEDIDQTHPEFPGRYATLFYRA